MPTKTPGFVALVVSWGVLGLSNATSLGVFLYLAAAVNPRSDTVAGLSILGTIVVWLGDLVAIVLAGVGGYRGRQRATAILSAVFAGFVALASAVVWPIVALGWALATAPVPIH